MSYSVKSLKNRERLYTFFVGEYIARLMQGFGKVNARLT